MIIAYICLFFLSYFDSESHIGGPSPAGVAGVVVQQVWRSGGVVVVAINAIPAAWRLMRSRRRGD